MNQEYKLFRISQLLSRFREQVKILNSNGEFSINIHAENIIIKVLNILFDCDLKNVNYEEGKTYPSIDLRDTTNKIAIQVTSTGNLEKVKHTLLKFLENKLYETFDTLYIFIITEKQSKYEQDKIDKITNGTFDFDVKNIIDRTDIYKQLNSQNSLDKIIEVCHLLERQFGDNKAELDKWDLYCKGLNEYDSFIRNYYKYLDVKGFSPKINNTLVKIGLSNIYVPLELKFETELLEDLDENEKKDKKITFTIERALSNFEKIVVLGDPGSGKSTILKFLAYKICTNRPIETEFSDLVPVLIKGSEFAKYVSQTSKVLSEYIIDHIDKKYELLFTEKLETNQLLVLIDGIDEINITSLRHAVVNRIDGFIAQYPEIKIIVSSRIVGYRETRLNGYFHHLKVNKFKEEQIERFIENWYSSVVSYSSSTTESVKENADKLLRSIRQNRSVLNMASNPLLVTIIALIHYQGGTLPEKRASLYDIATSTFLENWVRQRETQRTSKFDKETLVSILAPISYHIHQNFTTGLISEGELKKLLLKEYKIIYPYQNPKEEIQDLKEIIDFLREDAGFLFEKGLNENGESMFGFVHQTFQEFFTAIEFKTRWKEGFYKHSLEPFVFNPNWTEVIKLSASLFKLNEQSRLGRQYATEFLDDILNVDDVFPEMYRPLKLVVQTLIDDTEIEFPFFIELIDLIFKDILSNGDESVFPTPKRNREIHIFKYFIEQLLETKTYSTYLLDRIIKELNDESTSLEFKTNLAYILMRNSDNPDIKEQILEIIKGSNQRLKELFFNYNVVLPLAEVVLTQEFRDGIVGYINSDEYIKSYNGYLPTQYHCAFERSKKGNIKAMLDETSIDLLKEEIKNEQMLSIRVIKDSKIKSNYINFSVFSIGMSEADEVRGFLSNLKAEYPEMRFPKIEEYLKKTRTL